MKKSYTLVKLKNFKGGLHIARGLTNSYDKSAETLHSDTLKSALFVCALRLYSELEYEEASAYFFNNFKISSAFPFLQLAETNYYFPKPETPVFFKFENDGLTDKEKKKIKFIEKSVFEKYIQNPQYKIKDEELEWNVLNDKNYKAIVDSSSYQHVKIPKGFNQDSQPYYVDKLYFQKNAGLFFLLDFENTNPKVVEQVKAAIRLLGDSGVGTDRNSGNGQFETEIIENFELEIPESGDYQLSLSLYCPQEEEIRNDAIQNSFYGLTKRGGYISSPKNNDHLTIRKRSIYMFTEGSLFPYQPNRKGKLVDLKPQNDALKSKNIAVDHPVWRDGQPIFVPMANFEKILNN